MIILTDSHIRMARAAILQLQESIEEVESEANAYAKEIRDDSKDLAERLETRVSALREAVDTLVDDRDNASLAAEVEDAPLQEATVGLEKLAADADSGYDTFTADTDADQVIKALLELLDGDDTNLRLGTNVR